MCCCSCWFSAPSERSSGWKAGKEARCARGKTSRTGLQIVTHLQELILWAKSFYLLISRKALKFLMVTTVSWLAESFTWLAETFWKNMFDCMYAPITKITYMLSFPAASLEQCLNAIGGAVSQAAVLILPQIKLSSQLSGCASIFSRQDDRRSSPEWTSFLHWTPRGTGALVPAAAPCTHPPPQQAQTNLGKSPILAEILSFIW